ncbi:MAG: cupredoxin domain-containing protein [Terracidiphilus sp.]|jgi:cytochrome c oxidase subunit 2
MIKRFAILFVLIGICSSGPLLPLSFSADSAPRRIVVVAKRFSFEPATIELQKGVPVILVLKSVDVAHGLRFRELNVEVKAPKGGSGQVQFTPEKAGDFVGHCSVFCGSGHGSMSLTLHVIG